MIRNGLGFGNLGVTIRGTTKYHLSPMEQKAFAGAFSQGKPVDSVDVCPTFDFHFIPRSAQHLLESEEVLLHRGPSLHSLLLDLHRDREGTRQVER